MKTSWSLKYGTYYTTDEEQSTDLVNSGEVGIFVEQQQFSFYLDTSYPIGTRYWAGFLLAFDMGSLLPDSFDCLFKFPLKLY